jgi:hypothetical protein
MDSEYFRATTLSCSLVAGNRQYRKGNCKRFSATRAYMYSSYPQPFHTPTHTVYIARMQDARDATQVYDLPSTRAISNYSQYLPQRTQLAASATSSRAPAANLCLRHRQHEHAQGHLPRSHTIPPKERSTPKLPALARSAPNMPPGLPRSSSSPSVTEHGLYTRDFRTQVFPRSRCSWAALSTNQAPHQDPSVPSSPTYCVSAREQPRTVPAHCQATGGTVAERRRRLAVYHACNLESARNRTAGECLAGISCW